MRGRWRRAGKRAGLVVGLALWASPAAAQDAVGVVIGQAALGHPGQGGAAPVLRGPPPLREADVVARALAREAFQDVVAGAVGVAEAEVVAARRWKNPVLSYTFEQATAGGAGESEGIALIQQQIEPGKRRRLRTQAAQARVGGASERASMLKVEVEARVRRAFYQVLASWRRVEAAEDWAFRLDRVAEIAALRHRAGDVSGYDLQRVAREEATVRATAASARADQTEAVATLRGLIGDRPEDEGAVLVGYLLDPSPPPPLDELVRRIQLRPDVLALRAEARAASLEQRVAGGWKIPNFTLGAGYKEVRDPARDPGGAVAYAAVPLPLMDRQQAATRRARSRWRQASGSAEVLVQEARGQLRGTYAKERQLVEVARRFRLEALEPAEDLLGTAEAAYQAGEVGILSLLDAYRSAYEARRQYFEFALAARLARIELDRLAGGMQR